MGGAYANALVEVAQENNSLDDVHADMDALQSLFKDNEQIKTFLFNPVMTAEKKRDVVKKIGKEAGLSKYTTNFLNLLIDKDRIQAIEEIIDAFEKTYCKLTDTQVSISTMQCMYYNALRCLAFNHITNNPQVLACSVTSIARDPMSWFLWLP